MLDALKKHAKQAVRHANEAVALLKMSKQIHEAKKNGLIDETSAAEIIVRLNNEAAAEISESLRLQELATSESKKRKRAERVSPTKTP